MRDPHRPRICMLRTSEIIRDGRAIRTTRTLGERYDVVVLGVDRGRFAFDPAEQRRKLGLNIEWMPWLTRRLPKNSFGYLARYAEIFGRMIARGIALKPDVLHAINIDSLPIALAIQAATRARIVYDAYELFRDTIWFGKDVFSKALIRLETWAMKHRCEGIIACNHYRAEIMQKEYGAPFLPTVVRNVPIYQEYEPTDVLQKYVAQYNTSVKRICLYQGAIIDGRGLEAVVRSLAYLPEDVGLVFVGGGLDSYMQSLARITKEDGTADRFFLHGPVDHAELFRMTCSADLGVVTYLNVSRNNYYCAPNKLYEYSAAGVPMLGADLPSIREFFETYQNGTVFDPEDPKSLAQAAVALLHDRKGYDRCRQNCLAAAKIECWENESKELLALYESVLRR